MNLLAYILAVNLPKGKVFYKVVLNHDDHVRFPIRLWLTYGSLTGANILEKLLLFRTVSKIRQFLYLDRQNSKFLNK